MFVKEVIKIACEFLDKKDLADKIALGEKLSADEEKEVEAMISNFNLVREEVACEILPIVKCEKFKTKNLKVCFEDFSVYPVSILAVKDASGRKVRNRVLDDGIVAFANEIEVWYTARPEILTIDDEFSCSLPERVYAYGVAREYFIKKALYKDASVWEERFKNSLEMLDRNKQSRMVPRRRWL